MVPNLMSACLPKLSQSALGLGTQGSYLSCKPKWAGDLIITWEPVVCAVETRHWVTREETVRQYPHLVYCHVNPVFLHVTDHGSNKLRSLEFLCKIENKETS